MVTTAVGAMAMPAFGNDGFGELGLGGVVTLGKTQQVRMRREVLEVSPDLIRVDYVFEQTAPGANAAGPRVPVLFPLPLYSAEIPSWQWAGAPRGFSVTVNGERQAFTTVVKARQGGCGDAEPTRACGVDVTRSLKDIGLSDAQIALYPVGTPFRGEESAREVVPSLTALQARRLMRAGLLDEEGPVSPYPTWLADVSYQWELDFRDRRSVDVSHAYVPFTSGGSNSWRFTEDLLRNDYCADEAALNTWRRLVADAPPNPHGYGPVPGRRVEYILTTANSWAGPIEDFRLRLKKGKPGELVLLCFPGTRREIDPLTVEIDLHDFEPRNELRVLFLNVEPNGKDGVLPRGVAPLITR